MVLSRVLSVSANLISLVLVARILGADTFGKYTFIMAYLNIATSLADLGTTSVLARDLAREKDNSPDLYMGNFLYLRGTITLIATALALAMIPLSKPELLWPLLLCSLAIPVIASRFFDPVFQVFGKPQYSVYASLSYCVSLLAVSVVVLVWLELELLHFLAGWIACNLIYSVVAFRLSNRLVRPRFEIHWKTVKSIALLAAPLGVGALFSIINTRADVFMLSYLRTMQEVGYYSAGYKLLDLGSIMAITLLWPLIPILSRQLKDQPTSGKKTAQSVMELSALVCFPLAVITPYLASPVIHILYGEEYAESSKILGIFGVVFVILVYCLIGAMINISAGKVKHAYWNTALAVIVNIFLNFLLIPRFGIVGAAYATVASHVCMLIVQHAYVMKNVGNLFKPKFWFKIIGINLVMYLVLYLGTTDENIFLIPIVLGSYLVLVYLLRLMPEIPSRRRRLHGSEIR